VAKDYYATLGVNKNASKEEIKKAYKKLAKQYHPDINKDKDAEQKFKEINEATAVLGDDKKREQYDRFGTADFQGFSGQQGGFDFSGFDFDNIFDMFGGGFSGFGGRGRRKQSRGSDLQYEIEISLEDTALGAKKNIVIPTSVVCTKCQGRGAESESDIHTCSSCRGAGRVTKTSRTPFGMFQQTVICRDCGGEGKEIKNPCPVCDGEGRENKNSRIEVNIPQGVHDGTQLRLSGKGEAGYQGASPGDLYIVIRIKEHEIFERKGNNILCSVPISITQAILGAEIEVPTIGGKVDLDIPKGTQSHTLFKMKGKGLPDLHSARKGDEYVKVIVETPKNLTKKQKDLVIELGKNIKMEKKGFFERVFG